METITEMIVPVVWLIMTFLPALLLNHYLGKVGLFAGLIIMSVVLWLSGYFPIWLLGMNLIGCAILAIRGGDST